MVNDVRPPPPPPPPLLLLSLPPQAATPNARAVTRQPDAATERTRKVPSSRNAIPNGPRIYRSVETSRNGPRVETPLQSRLPGRYGARMRAVAPTTTTATVIMNESIALTPSAHMTSQMTRPKVVATTSPMRDMDST